MVLCAYESQTEGKKIKKHQDRKGQMKEIVCVQDPPLVHIYNILEHGRRFFRSLIFSSDADYCFRAMDPTPVIKYDVPSFISGSSKQDVEPADSVVITRNLTAELGVQTFIPNRMLFG
eukprot:COSAG01_NODE_38226_length_492_cov_1.114504_1_plen_117_part_10